MKKRLIAAVLTICMAAFAFPLSAAALSPALEVSQDYEKSVYYERLSQVELTGDWRRDIVSVALSQVGYHEGNSKADYAGDCYKGWHNFIEYSSVYYGMDAQWCAMFVSWCARQAGIPKYAVNNAVGAYADGSGGQGSTCFHVSVRYKKNYTPVTGDLVFFSSTGWGANHVGIVAGVTDTGIYTVEGNSLNAVRVNYYDFDDEYIAYYGVYAGQDESAPMDFRVSELKFVYTAGDHGTMPDGDDYSFDTLCAMHGTVITLPVNAFVRQGHTLQGYFARREGDGAWYCGGEYGWLSEEELTEKNVRPALLADGSAWNFVGGWTASDSFELFCVWKNKYGVIVFDSKLPPAVRADGEGWISPFLDMPESKWYYDSVRQAYRLGMIPLESTFRGEEPATRAQFIEMLFCGAGKPEAEEGTEAFADVPAGSQTYQAALWARGAGLTQGTGNNCFSPDAAMTRQEMTTMLYRWLGNGEAAAYNTAFADTADVSVWASDAMAWAVGNGVIHGVTVDGELYLSPQTAASRAEAVTVALRVTKLLAESGTEPEK